ncbi:MAG: RimK family alpha-L-glutamate ligase [Planctomycetota bacterium]
MKLGILSRHASCYSSRRLLDAAVSRGYDVEVFDTLQFSIDLEEGQPQLFYRSQPMDQLDAVLPRIGASVTYFGTAVVRQFEQMDVFCTNSSQGIANSRDKLRALQILSRHQIGIPKTTFVRNQRDVIPAIQRVGGAPIVIKLLEGTQGIGVILAEDQKIAEAIIETMQSTKQNVLVQKFVAESKGRDIRAFVVGDRVIASMRRIARGNEFRSNVHRGGRTEPVTLSEADQRLAVRAAQIMGLRVAGVDMLESGQGLQIMEVNSSPGLEAIEKCTRLDIAGAVIDDVAAQVHFPEIDIRQRLTESQGYGVSEIYVAKDSEFVGKMIDESGLPEQDITVLTLYRGNNVVPNPRLKYRLEAGDRLLCFGKLDSMQRFMPDQERNKRLPRIPDFNRVRVSKAG